jgi:hydroxyacylglutathione hydrolase
MDDLHLDPDAPVVVTCSVGHRAGLAVSILLRAGFKDVRNLLGGMTAWKALELPVE